MRAARSQTDPALQGLMVAAAAGTVGLVAHGLVEVSLRFQPPLFLLFALPAVALCAERIQTGDVEPRAGREIVVTGGVRLVISVVVGVVFGLALASTVSSFVASWRVASGRHAMEQGRRNDAEQAFRAAEAVSAGCLPARYRRAYVLWQLGHLERAAAEYREVIRRSPYYFDVNHHLARVLFAQGKLVEASRRIEVAVRINPFHVPSHELAVRLALKQGRVNHAERLAQHVVEVASHDLRARLALARVRLAQGRKTEAEQLLRRVLRDAPGNKEARRLLRAR